MANHQIDRNSLLRYVDGKLSEEEGEGVEVHLLSCQDCVQALEDLKAESLIREITARHRDIVEEVTESASSSGFRLRLRNLGNAAAPLVNEPVEILRRLLDSFKEISATPAFATRRGVSRSEFDSALKLLLGGAAVDFSRQADETRFSIKFLPKEEALRISLGGGSGNGMTKMSVFKSDSQRAILEMYADTKTGSFDLPLKLLNEDISLVWSSKSQTRLTA